MKKTLSFLIFAPALILSSTTLAATLGSYPQCNSGALNLVVVNQLDSDACFSKELKGKGTFCMIGSSARWSNEVNVSCEDLDTLYRNENASLSFEKAPNHASLSFEGYVFEDGNSKLTNLIFDYRNGTATNNCAAVLGPGTICSVTQSGDSDHKIYTLTISQ